MALFRTAWGLRRRLRVESLESRRLLTLTSTPLVGDATGDGIVNGQDIVVVASHWLQTGAQPLAGDLNYDGIVNGQDIAVIASHFGQTVGTLSVGTLTPPAAVEAQPITNATVYHFTDSNPQNLASNFTAQVTLGDGTVLNLSSAASANGQIVANPQGGFDVQISHTYLEESAGATFRVTVTSAAGKQTTSVATNSFSVADAPLTAGALIPPNTVTGVVFRDQTVFQFTDADPNASASDYTAVVNLGNGHAVTLTGTLGVNGRIVANGDGGFDVRLSYTYFTAVTNQIFSVTVTDVGGASTSASTDNFSVAQSPLVAGPLTPPLAIAGQAFSNVTIFQFTDTNPALTGGNYAAVVTLGDGNTVTLTSAPSANGQIVPDGSGGYDVQLSYTYAEVLTNVIFSLTVTAADGALTGASMNTFSVTLTPVQATPQIHLDATDASTVETVPGGALFNAAESQYMTEPDNPALDGLFNNTSQLTIEFQTRQATLSTNRNFLSKWNYGGNGSIAVATGMHSGDEGEIAVWFASFNGDIAGGLETQGANLLAGVTYDIAVVFNAGQVQIYVNGQAQTTMLETGSIPTTIAASGNIPLDLGRWNGLGRYLDGTIDNLNMWNVARTQAQIQSLAGDNTPYAQMNADQRTGLVQSFPLTENGGPSIDSVTGNQMLNPTGIVREQIVASWSGSGTLPTVFTPSPLGQAPDYVASVPSMNGQAALKFNGLDEGIKYASGQLPNEQSGDVFIVAQFTGGGDNLGVDTLFSSSSDTTAEDYVFFASYNTANTPVNEGGGEPLFRYRFRNGGFQTDMRGSQVEVQIGVTYVLHVWGLGTGNGYGMSINGLDDSPFYTTNPGGYPTTAGAWFGASANLTNLTIGDFERSDGAQGFAAALIAEIDVYAGTPAQPILPAALSAQIVDALLTKYGATRLGNDG